MDGSHDFSSMDNSSFLADVQKACYEEAAKILKAPPPIDFKQWAENNVVFGNESQFPGPYDRNRFPFFDEILDALSPEESCRIVSLLKSAQLGGTVLAQVFMGATMELDPCWMINYHPSRDNASKFKNNKWDTFVEQCESLKKLLNTEGEKGTKSSTFQQDRLDKSGSIMFLGAQSGPALSQHSAKKQVQDDLAKWEVLSEGDSETLADARSSGFEYDAKIFKASTPLIMPGCRITNNYNEGTQERYQVPCPHCGHMHELTWENFIQNLDCLHPERAHFSCPDCGGVIEQHHRDEMNRRGEWVAKYPERKGYHRSFFIWSAYSPIFSWERLAREWLTVEGDPGKEQSFWNDKLGQAYEQENSTPDWESLAEKAEELAQYRTGIIPPQASYLFAGVDCQQDRIEVQIVGVGRGMRVYPVQYLIEEGHISEEKVRIYLNDLLSREWPDSYGGKRRLDMLAIDSGYSTNDVYEFVKRHPDSRVIAVKGTAREDFGHRASKWPETDRRGKQIRTARQLWLVGAGFMKAWIYQNLQKEDPLEPGYILFPHGFDPEYYRELCSERRVPEKLRSGHTVYKWKKDPSVDNEALDTLIYALICARRLGLHNFLDDQWDAVEADRCKPPDDVQFDLLDPAQQVQRQTTQKRTKAITDSFENKLAAAVAQIQGGQG